MKGKMTITDIDAAEFKAADKYESVRNGTNNNLWLPHRKVSWLHKCRHLRVLPKCKRAEKGKKWK
jgi:hypothetical protein